MRAMVMMIISRMMSQGNSGSGFIGSTLMVY